MWFYWHIGFMKKVALTIAVTVFLGGCAMSDTNTSPIPAQSSAISAEPSQAPSSAENQAILYFVSDTGKSFRLFSEQHDLISSSGDLVTDALATLLSGVKPKDSDYTNLWSSDSRLNGLTVNNGFATVDLHFEQLNVGAETELRAIEQILWTLKVNNPEISKVEFLRDGNIVESFAGHVDTLDVFQIDEGYQSLATIDLDLDEGAVIKSGDPVTGLACTFEANAPWELFQDGQLISSGAETAEMACPVRSKFSISLGPLKPGSYLLRVWESSMEDGSLINEDTKNLVVK